MDSVSSNAFSISRLHSKSRLLSSMPDLNGLYSSSLFVLEGGWLLWSISSFCWAIDEPPRNYVSNPGKPGGANDTGGSELRSGKMGGADEAPFWEFEHESMWVNCMNVVGGDRDWDDGFWNDRRWWYGWRWDGIKWCRREQSWWQWRGNEKFIAEYGVMNELAFVKCKYVMYFGILCKIMIREWWN